MLSYEFPPLGGGIGVSCQSLLREFELDSSIIVDLITSGTGDKLEITEMGERIRIFKLPVGKKSLHFWRGSEIARWTWGASRISKRLSTQHDYDLCHCWGGWPAGLLGYRLRKEMPYVVGLRGSDVPGYNVRLRLLDRLVFQRMSRRVWAHATQVLANSENLKSLARETSGDVPITVIRNGVDCEMFRPGPATQPMNFLYVGRLIERKGLFYLLEAFDALIKATPDLHLTLAGNGPDRDRLERYCQDHGLGSSVEFSGRMDREQLQALYRGASVFVMPSLEESLPNAALEAMASGLPIVTTKTGATELLSDNGLAVETGDSEALRQALKRYVEEPEMLRTHGKRSRELAESMTWEAMARCYRETFEEILGSDPTDHA
jgi:glycosyltransferase involved in cell wall biosynthesis